MRLMIRTDVFILPKDSEWIYTYWRLIPWIVLGTALISPLVFANGLLSQQRIKTFKRLSIRLFELGYQSGRPFAFLIHKKVA